MAIPKYDQLFNSVLQALRELGGSATNQELEAKVIELLDLPEDEAYRRLEGKSQTVLDYRTAWAKSYLKSFGLLDNAERGVWALNAAGKRTTEVDPSVVKASVKTKSTPKDRPSNSADDGAEEQPIDEKTEAWRDHLLSILLEVSPDAFERLGQRRRRNRRAWCPEVAGTSIVPRVLPV